MPEDAAKDGVGTVGDAPMYRPGPVIVTAVTTPPVTVNVPVGLMLKLPLDHARAKVPFVPPLPPVMVPTLAWVRPRGTLAAAALG